MSTNVSFSGVAVKIPKEKTNKDSLLEIVNFLKLSYSEKEIENLNKDSNENDDYYFHEILQETRKKMWRLYRDYNGIYGLIYLIDDDYDVFDITHKMSLETVNEIVGELFNQVPKDYLNMDASQVNTFAYLYYNGSDNPFTF